VRHERDELGRVDANKQARCAGGIKQRAEDVEHRAYAQRLAHWHDGCHRRMEDGREHKRDRSLVDARTHLLGREVELDAERLQDVG
jgi:hypothetical protein